MRIFSLSCLFTILLLMASISKVDAQGSFTGDTVSKNTVFKKQVRVSGLFYMAGQYKQQESSEYLEFMVRRAYITAKADLTKKLSVRYTQDITIDDEGDDAGNIELRIKYLFLQYKVPDVLIFTGNHLKFGIVQRPWIDFEEHVNAYRVQGTMFMERSSLFNSSGFGFSFNGNIGGKLQGDYVEKVHPQQSGKYGSFSFGLFNGGGYHQFEANMNKNFEARITIRPLPGFLPGLQFSFISLYGKGNIAETPDFILNAGFVSYETRFLTLTAQYEKGQGNTYGSYVDSSYQALSHHGLSMFGEIKIPKSAIALFARYDYFKLDGKMFGVSGLQIYGISWRFYKQNKLVFSYQKSNSFGNASTKIYDLAVDISF